MVSSVITFDKITTKRTLAGRDINPPARCSSRRGEVRCGADRRRPGAAPLRETQRQRLVVRRHESPGHFEEPLMAIAAAFAQGDEILVEECIAGREMGCGVMIMAGRSTSSPSRRSSPQGVLRLRSKYTAGRSKEITPADIAPEVKAELNRMTLEAYRTCRCSGVVRVDFIVTPEGRPVHRAELDPRHECGQHRPRRSAQWA